MIDFDPEWIIVVPFDDILFWKHKTTLLGGNSILVRNSKQHYMLLIIITFSLIFKNIKICWF